MCANTGELHELHSYKLKSRTILNAFKLKSVIKALRRDRDRGWLHTIYLHLLETPMLNKNKVTQPTYQQLNLEYIFLLHVRTFHYYL